EVALLDDAPRALRMLSHLRERGVQALLDDFGTGFSALSYLHRFPIQSLKIDRSFVAGLDGDTQAESLALVRAILALAGTLGIDTIGEGIETEEQRRILLELGCPFGQGYLYGHPPPRWSRPLVASALPASDKPTIGRLYMSLMTSNLGSVISPNSCRTPSRPNPDPFPPPCGMLPTRKLGMSPTIT